MTTRSNSRKGRGYKTQELLAERWRENGFAPFAVAVGNGKQGKDIHNTPGLIVEVKARDTVTIPKAIRQARGDGQHFFPSGLLPILVFRHNGQGEKSMDEWTVSMTLLEFEELWMSDAG